MVVVQLKSLAPTVAVELANVHINQGKLPLQVVQKVLLNAIPVILHVATALMIASALKTVKVAVNKPINLEI